MPATRRASAFERWREQGEGFSPLFSEPLLERALGHLEPARAPGSTALDLGAGPIVENLAGNPFMRVGRWLRAASGTPYPPHLKPRRYLRWDERAIFEHAFRDVRCEPFHWLTPMLLAWSSMSREPVARERDIGLRALHARLRRWDPALLRRWPGGAWCMVVCGVR